MYPKCVKGSGVTLDVVAITGPISKPRPKLAGPYCWAGEEGEDTVTTNSRFGKKASLQIRSWPADLGLN